MPYIDIDGYEDVEIKFTDNNIKEILEEVNRINEKSNNTCSEEDIRNLEKALKLLTNLSKTFSLEAYINEVWIDEYDLKELTSGNYDDGYNDAMDRIETEQKAITQNYGCLLQKIEHLAYGYGKQEPLTKEEIQTIRDILKDKLKSW